MRKTITNIASLFCLISLMAFNANAQKFGYVNSTEILAELPAIKSADSELEAYQQQLVTKGEQMVKSFEANYTKLAEQAQAGTLSNVQMQQKEAELSQEQQTIQAYEVEIQNKLLKKREELYQPILENVNNVLKAMGDEGGYTMIFDSSTGGILHADDTNDLTSTLKSKLGI